VLLLLLIAGAVVCLVRLWKPATLPDGDEDPDVISLSIGARRETVDLGLPER